MHQRKIEVLHITKKEIPDITSNIKHIADLKYSITYESGTGNTTRDLSNYLEGSDAKLFCLIRSKKHFFDSLLNDSATLKQTFNSSVPLLILHN